MTADARNPKAIAFVLYPAAPTGLGAVKAITLHPGEIRWSLETTRRSQLWREGTT